MTTDDASARAAAWAEVCLDVKLPDELLAALAPAARRVIAGVAERAGALAMEDEPAGFVAAFERLADAGR